MFKYLTYSYIDYSSYFFLALGFSLILSGLCYLFSVSYWYFEKITSYECGFDPFSDTREPLLNTKCIKKRTTTFITRHYTITNNDDDFNDVNTDLKFTHLKSYFPIRSHFSIIQFFYKIISFLGYKKKFSIWIYNIQCNFIFFEIPFIKNEISLGIMSNNLVTDNINFIYDDFLCFRHILDNNMYFIYDPDTSDLSFFIYIVSTDFYKLYKLDGTYQYMHCIFYLNGDIFENNSVNDMQSTIFLNCFLSLNENVSISESKEITFLFENYINLYIPFHIHEKTLHIFNKIKSFDYSSYHKLNLNNKNLFKMSKRRYSIYSLLKNNFKVSVSKDIYFLCTTSNHLNGLRDSGQISVTECKEFKKILTHPWVKMTDVNTGEIFLGCSTSTKGIIYKKSKLDNECVQFLSKFEGKSILLPDFGVTHVLWGSFININYFINLGIMLNKHNNISLNVLNFIIQYNSALHLLKKKNNQGDLEDIFFTNISSLDIEDFTEND